MARVVLIIDSSKGELIDVAGNVREGGGKYAKFAKRMLSLDNNPVLDYGLNGGDTLTISKNGVDGALINLKAAVVKVSGTLKIGDSTLQQLIESGQANKVTAMIKGKSGEIKVDPGTDADTGKEILTISLDNTLATKLQEIEDILSGISDVSDKYVSKAALSEVLAGVYVSDDASPEEVRAQLKALVDNLKSLADSGSSEPSGA